MSDTKRRISVTLCIVQTPSVSPTSPRSVSRTASSPPRRAVLCSCLPVWTFARKLPPLKFVAKRLVRDVQAARGLFPIPSRLLQHREDDVFLCFLGCETSNLL